MAKEKKKILCHATLSKPDEIRLVLGRPYAQMVCEDHENGFAFYGGIPNTIVYDQDRTMIVDENIGDIILTSTFIQPINQIVALSGLTLVFAIHSEFAPQQGSKWKTRNEERVRIWNAEPGDCARWLVRNGPQAVAHVCLYFVLSIIRKNQSEFDLSRRRKKWFPIMLLSTPGIPMLMILLRATLCL